jgi:hypothetical protein
MDFVQNQMSVCVLQDGVDPIVTLVLPIQDAQAHVLMLGIAFVMTLMTSTSIVESEIGQGVSVIIWDLIT